MYTFKDSEDLMRFISRQADMAEALSTESATKREIDRNRIRAAAFRQCLEYLKDFFEARKGPA